MSSSGGSKGSLTTRLLRTNSRSSRIKTGEGKRQRWEPQVKSIIGSHYRAPPPCTADRQMAVNARGDAKSLKRTHVAQHRGRFYVNSNVILNSRIIQNRVLNQSVISKTGGKCSQQWKWNGQRQWGRCMLDVIKGGQGWHGDSWVSEGEGSGEEVGGVVGTCGPLEGLWLWFWVGWSHWRFVSRTRSACVWLINAHYC